MFLIHHSSCRSAVTYEPLHHKYRPQTFADLVGQEAIAQTLANAIRTRRIAPAYLFAGPRGTGKTSSARILAKSLNCLQTETPTATPCGTCEVCRGIASGATLDVVEIDAASNTGVDNIRDLIERSQFAPVQCRYKVYVIDECLTGDALVLSDRGLMRIDDPSLRYRQVLSYNDSTREWEWKPVRRWLDRGTRATFEIRTTRTTIRCTGNHLIRTDKGWIATRDLAPGMKILSPVAADIEESPTVTSGWERLALASGSETSIPTQFQKWNTNLETIASVRPVGVEPVYDIEVADNHNFVANGLLVHNCHMLSTAAFNALLKTLEEPPDRVVFVLATTDPQRVLPTIISRCQRFDFRRIPLDAMTEHLQAIAQKEQIPIVPEAVYMVAQIAQGGLRDAESLLDQLSLLSGEIDVERVWDLVGAVPERDLMALVKAIATHDATAVLDRTRELLNRGREPLIVLQNLGEFYRDLLIAKTAPDRGDLVKLTGPTWDELCQFAQNCDRELILAAQKHLRDSEVQIKNTTQPRLWLEVTLLGLLPDALRPAAAPAAPTAIPMQSQSQTQRVASGPSQSQSQTQRVPVARSEPKPTPPPKPAPPPPPPAPQPEPAPAAAEMSPSPAEVDLDQIWRQILEAIEQLGTQALMRQHGCLRSWNGNLVCIGIKSSPLLKIAQSKLASLEAACRKVFPTPVQVRLEVGTDAAPPLPPPPPKKEEPEPPPPPPKAAPAAPPPEPTPAEPPQVPLPRDTAEAVAVASQKLADFFEGEVLPLTEEESEVGLEEPPEFDVEEDSEEEDIPF